MGNEYFVQWGHAYLMHFGAWVSFMIGAQVYKTGLPQLKDLSGMFKVSLILATVLSAFSSHSQNHYLNHFSSAKEGKVVPFKQ